MSSTRKPQPPTGKKDFNETLDEILNFGPETTETSVEIAERIQAIVKKLQELSVRLDALSSRF